MFLTAALKVAVREAEVVTADEVLTTPTPSLSILFLLPDSMGKVLVPPDPRVTVPLCVRVVMAACSRLPLSGVAAAIALTTSIACLHQAAVLVCLLSQLRSLLMITPWPLLPWVQFLSLLFTSTLYSAPLSRLSLNTTSPSRICARTHIFDSIWIPKDSYLSISLPRSSACKT